MCFYVMEYPIAVRNFFNKFQDKQTLHETHNKILFTNLN